MEMLTLAVPGRRRWKDHLWRVSLEGLPMEGLSLEPEIDRQIAWRILANMLRCAGRSCNLVIGGEGSVSILYCLVQLAITRGRAISSFFRVTVVLLYCTE